MAQFYTLEEAAARLGDFPEDFKRRQKTEWTSIRPFRDGATLRFRTADIDELARSLGAASDPGLPLGPVGSAAAESDADVPLVADSSAKSKARKSGPLDLGGEDIFTIPSGDSGKSKGKSKSGSDSDVRLDSPGAPRGHDPEAFQPTEEIALDVAGPGSSAIHKSGSGKLSASKSGTKLAGPDSAKIPSAVSKSGTTGPDSSSEFELSLDSESDSFELQLTTDSSEEVDLGTPAPADKGRSAQSGINLGKPTDSGLSLEKKGPKSGPPKPSPNDPDSDLDFELSLDAGGASSTRLSGPKSEKIKKGVDSSSEFELTLDDDSGVVESLANDLAAPDENKGDIFETDFELPVMQDESGSEVVAVDAADGDSSEFEVDITDADMPVDESASQVMLVDDDEAPLIEEELVEEDGGSASSALRGVRHDEDDAVTTGPVQMVVAGPAKWGPLPAIVMFPTLILVFLGGLMSFEVVRGMWGYHQPSKPGSAVVRGMADTFGWKTND